MIKKDIIYNILIINNLLYDKYMIEISNYKHIMRYYWGSAFNSGSSVQ